MEKLYSDNVVAKVPPRDSISIYNAFNDFPNYRNRSRRKKVRKIEKLSNNLNIFLHDFGLILKITFGVEICIKNVKIQIKFRESV